MKNNVNEKQIHILNVAEELIAQKGFEGTSVRDIARSAKVNVAMISYYFGSKDKMMTHLVQHRIRKTREMFAEFAETIKEGKPEMQLKALIEFIVAQTFKYYYFHAYIISEIRKQNEVKEELFDYYRVCVDKLDEVIRKGVAAGVFTYAPKAEDVYTTIRGTTLFVIRNKEFYEEYMPHARGRNYWNEAEKKTRLNVLLTVLSLLGYSAD